jgi:uncharacterized protein YjcR
MADKFYTDLSSLGMTQKGFAERYGKLPNTISEWKRRGVPKWARQAAKDMIEIRKQEST